MYFFPPTLAAGNPLLSGSVLDPPYVPNSSACPWLQLPLESGWIQFHSFWPSASPRVLAPLTPSEYFHLDVPEAPQMQQVLNTSYVSTTEYFSLYFQFCACLTPSVCEPEMGLSFPLLPAPSTHPPSQPNSSCPSPHRPPVLCRPPLTTAVPALASQLPFFFSAACRATFLNSHLNVSLFCLAGG